MITTVFGVYEGGVIRPATPLPLADGTAVQLTVAAVSPTPPSSGADTAAFLLAVAAQRVETGPVERTSEEHDQILYGEAQP